MREGLFAQAWNALPRNLSTVAFHDPYKAIRNFCRYKNEQDWIFILAALTELALGKDTLQESFPTENPFAIRKKLLGVVEASHLIWVRKLTRLEAS